MANACAVKITTSIVYKKKTFRGFDFEKNVQSLDDVRRCVKDSIGSEMSPSYGIEIEDENEFVQLNESFLKHKRPWYQDEKTDGEEVPSKIVKSKKVKLKIIEMVTAGSSGKIHEYRFRSDRCPR